jgi:ABC-2 type transport system permease protein
MISFLNLGLAGFVLAAVAARFIFPGISLEGRQMWLLRSSPLDAGSILWSKYWIGTVPLLFLALVITIFTNWLLDASQFMMAVAVGTIVLYTLAASALALSFGTLYPQFGSENAAQIPTSFGGLVYMMSSLSLLAAIIIIEAAPVTGYLRLDRFGGHLGEILPDLALAAILVLGICVAATIIPLRLAHRRIEMMEW